MLIGIVGAPNKGKSTLFSALTMNDVPIADYPFTTIKPNLGVAYATKECADKGLGVKCDARGNLCVNHVRKFPINIVDVAGLVSGAHEGRGMGNQFLNDLSASEALILVVDASGGTDAEGNKAVNADPVMDVEMIEKELVHWLADIVKRNMPKVSKRTDGPEAMQEVLASLKVTAEEVRQAAQKANLSTAMIAWPDDGIRQFAGNLLKITKPMVIAANKSDSEGAEENAKRLAGKFGKENVVPCSAAIELALRKAAKKGIIEYNPGERSFKELGGGAPEEQASALKYMKGFLEAKGTNVQELINRAAFALLDNIVVYPVEDEGSYSDHSGNVLPDGILIKRGSTALDLAAKIHTDLAKTMLYAVDARRKMRLSKDYVLKDNDVIKIVSTAK